MSIVLVITTFSWRSNVQNKRSFLLSKRTEHRRVCRTNEQNIVQMTKRTFLQFQRWDPSSRPQGSLKFVDFFPVYLQTNGFFLVLLPPGKCIIVKFILCAFDSQVFLTGSLISQFIYDGFGSRLFWRISQLSVHLLNLSCHSLCIVT